MAENDFQIDTKDSHAKISGSLDLYHLNEAEEHLKEITSLDLSKITHLDTAGAMFLHQLNASGVKIQNLDAKYQSLLDLTANTPETIEHKEHRPSFTILMENLGRSTINVIQESMVLISFFGQACVELLKVLLNPKKLRMGAVISQLEHIGIHAIPIIGLMSFLIAIVLAYQGVAQLRPLGAEQFTVNLIAISVLREMGVLLTAILVAGRSGSAFTAEIGVMKLREEIDALESIGIKPFEILVVPRLIALIIALPLLTFISDMLGLLGGALLSMGLIGTSLTEYLDRVQHAVKLSTFMVGMVKAPVFALAIGIVGCLHGMKVSGSSESVGRETTASVVKSIFLVLLLDALFSILFNKLGI